MGNRRFLWLVAVLIGSALVFPPVIAAAETKAAQPCAPGEIKKEEEKKEEKKGKKVTPKMKGEKKEGATEAKKK